MSTPYYQDDLCTIFHGDCLEVMRGMPDESVHAVVTDPPYNLSDSGKRDFKCFRQLLAEVFLPSDDERDSQSGEGGNFPIPAFGSSTLGGVSWASGVNARVGVPEGSVDFEGASVIEQEIDGGDVSPVSATDGGLPLVGDSHVGEGDGDFVLQLAYGGDSAFCNGTCSCFTEPSAGFISVAVVVSGFAGGDGAGDGFHVDGGDADVRGGDYSGGESEGSSGVHAGGGAVRRGVLRLDLRGGSGELDFAGSAPHGAPVFAVVRAEGVAASAGARRLSPVAKPYRVCEVGGSAVAFTLYHLGHAANSTKGFMGKEWDGWASPASFQRWCTEWTVEALRVLKPGGHILAFGGSRTWHRLAVAVEDAGFELRDSIAWLYGSGFPKSLDVSKAIDKAAGAEREVIGDKMRPDGKTVLSARNAIADPVSEGWDRPWRYDPARLEAQGKVTAPATDAAKKWAGFGTALKPAFEPIVVGRKPLVGTVAQNVLAHGTGALNIDGCRIGADGGGTHCGSRDSSGQCVGHDNAGRSTSGQTVHGLEQSPSGRWPSNVVLDEGQAEALDKQSGVLTSGSGKRRPYSETQPSAVYGMTLGAADYERDSDSGGASRFFPTFRYEAKAPSNQRPNADGIQHPTVKPLDLMRWLVRLVTPPGGTVLDPFAGSGTTLEAALIEGFHSIGIEREADYLPLIMQRISKPLQQSLFGESGF